MALKKPLTILFAIMALLSGTALLLEFLEWKQARLYNIAVIERNFLEASKQDSGARGLFANAYAEQEQGHFQEARVIYGMLESIENDDELRLDVLFNLANTYMQQASAFDLENDADQVMPLIELAKASYRELLAVDSQHWDAKFNLERALQILPDVGNLYTRKSKGPRSPVPTVITANTQDNLP